MKFLNTKGLGRLVPAIQILIVVGILLGIGILILDEFQDQTTDATAVAAINATAVAIGDFADWLPIIVIGIAAMVLLGLVVGGLMRGAGGGRGRAL